MAAPFNGSNLDPRLAAYYQSLMGMNPYAGLMGYFPYGTGSNLGGYGQFFPGVTPYQQAFPYGLGSPYAAAYPMMRGGMLYPSYAPFGYGYSGGGSNQKANSNGYQGNSMRSGNGSLGMGGGQNGKSGNLNGLGKLDWPLGLRILPPNSETKGLRQEVDTLYQVALLQASRGQVQPRLVGRAKQDIEELRRMLDKKAPDMPVSDFTITEARRFLRRTKGLLQALSGSQMAPQNRMTPAPPPQKGQVHDLRSRQQKGEGTSKGQGFAPYRKRNGPAPR